MINQERKLRIEQLDRKFKKLGVLKGVEPPTKGWINTIRTTLNISLGQLARRLNKTSVSVGEIEGREQNKTITLNKLIEVGEALDLQFVYGFLPKESSIEKMIDKRAQKVGRDIVMRASHTMKLEGQENSKERLEHAIKEKIEDLKREVPKYLWD